MNEDFEHFARSQLITMKSHMDLLTKYLQEYEERNIRLKQILSQELIISLVKRFEDNEKMIHELNQKLEERHFKLEEQLTKEIRTLRYEISETDLTRAISTISGENKFKESNIVKVNSRPLEELKRFLL